MPSPMVNPMTEKRHFTEQLVRVPKQMGAAIRRRRRMLQLSQKDVGAKACVRQATISALENGEWGTRMGTILDVITALDLEFVVRERSKADKDIEELF